MVAITVEQAFQTALAFHRAGRMEAAEALYRQIVAAEPGKAEAWQQLGLVASAARRHEEATVCFRRMVELRPDLAEAHCNLGAALTEVGAWDEGVASFRRALILDPRMAEAHSNLGRTLTKQGRYDEAVAAIECALKLKPGVPATYGNLGHALFRSGRFDEAVACYREWIARHPQDATAHRSLGHVLLLLGHFAEGWKEFEWRQNDPATPWVHRRFSQPRWDGTAMPGETLLLHAEQGFGDAIQFLRYLPLVHRRAAASRVIIECPPKLVRLFRQSCDEAVEVVPGEMGIEGDLPPFDRHCALMSLPFVLGESEPLSMAEPYLRVDPASRAAWQTRLGADGRVRVGLSWAGSAVHVNDQRRSIAATSMMPLLLSHPDVDFYSLQVEAHDVQPLRDAGLIDLTPHLADFADTAAMIAELDLIISVDTAIVHLAGACGRPVWTLLPFAPDWRWGAGGDETRWYPTMRLFRQETPGIGQR
ncbi:MAG: tetratricopeptide repeat-containing glycosyltransferase family protein [Chthoniobacter sp.]|nr:tetratricopeptide repeat-containing glycosyltransferase family protein [Chthoniobacter sp.]